jgi:hypothetical protein
VPRITPATPTKAIPGEKVPADNFGNSYILATHTGSLFN